MRSHKKRLFLKYSRYVAYLYAWLATASVSALPQTIDKKKLISLPAVGERTYLLPSEKSSQAVSIESGREAGNAGRLRDPRQPGHGAAVSAEPEPSKIPTKSLRVRAAQLKFKPLGIRAKISDPRVEFTRGVLPIGRADVPVSDDFLEKVFTAVDGGGF